MSLFFAEKAFINSSELRLGKRLTISFVYSKKYLEQEHNLVVWRKLALSYVFEIGNNFSDLSFETLQGLDFLLDVA